MSFSWSCWNVGDPMVGTFTRLRSLQTWIAVSDLANIQPHQPSFIATLLVYQGDAAMGWNLLTIANSCFGVTKVLCKKFVFPNIGTSESNGCKNLIANWTRRLELAMCSECPNRFLGAGVLTLHIVASSQCSFQLVLFYHSKTEWCIKR